MNRNIHICHRCTYRQADCIGPCMCLHDPTAPVEIMVRAGDGCPAGKFNARCHRCDSEFHREPDCPIAPNADPELERNRLIQGGCCGQPSQQE
jgi:hypothetical protein